MPRSRTKLALRYLKFYIEFLTQSETHSPFGARISRSLKKTLEGYSGDPDVIAEYRSHWTQHEGLFEHMDFGHTPPTVSSKKLNRYYKKVSKNAMLGRLLQWVIWEFKPTHLIELGTALGVSSTYIGTAMRKDAKLTTFEGSESLCDIVRPELKQIHPKIDVVSGNIDQTLSDYLSMNDSSVDFAFIDANHRYEPTIRYTKWLLHHGAEQIVIVFDDIYWSEGMEKAWNVIKQMDEFQVILDVFWMGIAIKSPQYPNVKQRIKLSKDLIY